MHAKLQNGFLRSAPKTIVLDGRTINNPYLEELEQLGYKPVVYTDMPTEVTEGKHWESGWTETDTDIRQVWTLVDDPVYPEPELSADEALNIIMGWYSDKETSRTVKRIVGKSDSKYDR